MVSLEELYSHIDPAWRDPLPLVEEGMKFLRPGSIVLDIGAGAGRHALLLASKGFLVDAIDRDPDAVVALNAIARQYRLPLRMKIIDVAREGIIWNYDMIICAFVLPLLSRPQGILLRKMMQLCTFSGGLNIVAAITTEGDSCARDAYREDKCFLRPGELRQWYEGWRIHSYHEEQRLLKGGVKKEDGSVLENICSFILAQKPTAP